MANRRELILETARRLFAKRGYNGVSMRDIAGELGFSVGNVTYYFKKKEDLMEASVLEQSQSYHLPPTPTNLMELNQLYYYVCDDILNKIYYFHNYTQMAQISQRIYELQCAYKRDLYLTLNTAIENLQKNGDMEPDSYEGQTAYFIRGLMTTMTYWAPYYSSSEESETHNRYEFLMCIWSLTCSRLTDKGMNTFQNRILKKLDKISLEKP